MSTLKTVEKKYFADMFNMDSGYVLDFTNNTFAVLFRETVAIDIYSPQGGDRVRSFFLILLFL